MIQKRKDWRQLFNQIFYQFYQILQWCKIYFNSIMAYLIVKVALLALIFTSVLADLPSNDTASSFVGQSCCPKDYNSAGIYCVKCTLPKHWDALTQRCVTCEPGHTWDNVTHQCSCCQDPRSIVEGQCVCPAPRTWDQNLKDCTCPAPRTWDSAKKQCVCTGLQNVWNGNQCVCPAGTYGPNCVTCAAPRHWDNTLNQCVCNSPFTWNESNCVCPDGFFLYQGRCAQCPAGFNWTNNQCKKCECSYKDLQILKATN